MKLSKNLWGQLLFVEVFLFVFVLGFLPYSLQSYSYSILYTILFFTSAFNLDKHRKTMLWVAGSAIVLEWLSKAFDLVYIRAASNIFNGIFFTIIVGLFIAQVANAKEVKKRVIFEAINGYLLLGIVFSISIALMLDSVPDAYNFSNTEFLQHSDIVYFGFVTLSTLGYGDLLPVHQASKSLALLTTLGGQLYLAVIIALLVGKFSSQRE
ncbi:MAG: two pore domain potassium channel family protein [Reichenbachiella sp.]